MNDEIYDYTSSGFDNFLSRGLDDVAMTSLDSQGPISRQVAYDRNQITGLLGDVLQIGRVQINGSGYVSVTDEEGNEVTRFGDLEV